MPRGALVQPQLGRLASRTHLPMTAPCRTIIASKLLAVQPTVEPSSNIDAFPTLRSPPIIEAVIEFRGSGQSQPDLEAVRGFSESLGSIYQRSQELRVWRTELRFDDGGMPSSSHDGALVGFRLESDPPSYVVQAKLDGLAISRLAPYEGWGPFLSEARRLWRGYVKHVRPATVSRIGVRYINRIAVVTGTHTPTTQALRKIVRTGPQIPKKLPQHMTEFVSRVVLPLPLDSSFIVLTHALEPAIAADQRPWLILDIDAFSEKPFEVDSLELWDRLDELRTAKNQTFFGCVTNLGLKRSK